MLRPLTMCYLEKQKLLLQENKIEEMKKIMKIAAVIALTASMTSCAVSGPYLVTDNAGTAKKTGEASYKVILWFPPFNADASIATAAKNGGITKISTVDTKVKSSIFTSTYTTIVTGE